MDWKRTLTYDPLPVLLTSKNPALVYLTNRDLIESEPGLANKLWDLPVVQRLVTIQQENGSWKYHGGREHVRSSEDYNQIETYRILRELVEKYLLDKDHPALRSAAEFLFSHQTTEGDIRGICGNQYVPYYSAAMMELLIKAGYANDPRITKGFRWLISVRQDDGGWAFPLRTRDRKLDSETFNSDAIQPDKSKPSSHLITGMVLRAFAAHPVYRMTAEARISGELLANRFFKADKYPDRRAPSFWTSFSFPFWFTDLLSSLDSLSLLAFDSHHSDVSRGLAWLLSKQRRDGLWDLSLRIMKREIEPRSWITLAVCRVLKRFRQ